MVRQVKLRPLGGPGPEAALEGAKTVQLLLETTETWNTVILLTKSPSYMADTVVRRSNAKIISFQIHNGTFLY